MTTEFDLIRRYTGAFSKEDCEGIIKDIQSLEDKSFLSYDKSALHLQDHEAINIAYNYDWDLPTSTRLSKNILPKFKQCCDEYLQTFSVLGRNKFLIYDLKIKKIPICGGFHNWHFENGSISDAPRAFVMQLYLNDDFDGGETEFLYQNRREEAVAGDVIIFPAGYTHVHRGNPPIGGTKYIATSWAITQDSDGL